MPKIRCLLRSEEHTSELQSRQYLVCRLLLEKKNTKDTTRDARAASKTFPPVFFPMIRQPPTSTLFPTRRSSDLAAPLSVKAGFRSGAGRALNRFPEPESAIFGCGQAESE